MEELYITLYHSLHPTTIQLLTLLVCSYRYLATGNTAPSIQLYKSKQETLYMFAWQIDCSNTHADWEGGRRRVPCSVLPGMLIGCVYVSMYAVYINIYIYSMYAYNTYIVCILYTYILCVYIYISSMLYTCMLCVYTYTYRILWHSPYHVILS